jgi:hypothetical protein
LISLPWKQILLLGDAAVLGNTTPPNDDFTAASAGVATTAARSDHKHSATPAPSTDLAIIDGLSASGGIINSEFVRADHKHALGTPLQRNTPYILPTILEGLSMAENEIAALALENLNAVYGITTTKMGRIYFCMDSGDKHPYIYTG